MNRPSIFHVKKHSLLGIAGCVWLIAGFNVARLGVLSYGIMETISFVHIALSVLVFCAFGFMFFKMSIKHTKRIRGYEEEWKPVWHFFDLKAYCIMAVMMGSCFWYFSLAGFLNCILPPILQSCAITFFIISHCMYFASKKLIY